MENGKKPAGLVYLGEELPKVVKEALGRRNALHEQQLWAAMSPKQRERSVQRIEAINRWHGERSGWTADDAALAADLSKPRFYTLAMTWEDVEARSLALLGVQAKTPRRRQRWKPEIVKAISDGAASVAQLAENLHDRLAGRFEDFPKASTLRSSIIEARRLATLGDEVGTDIAFDACATNIPSPDNRPHVAFVAIDRATGFILGTSIGDISDSVGAYRELALEIKEGLGERAIDFAVPWAERVERIEFVIGSDLEAFRKWEAELKGAIAKVNIQGSNKPRRFGRYLKEHVGTVIGRIRLLPAQTLKPTADYALPGQVVTEIDAAMKLRLEVNDHNRDVSKLLSGKAGGLPHNLTTAINRIASTG
jgi:hypothetical protein